MSDRMELIERKFVEIYGDAPTFVVRAPGRVNLIGEHTDYNEGFVFPIAIDRDVLAAVKPRRDRTVRMHAMNFDGSSEFSLDDIQHDTEQTWSNYLRGVASVLEQRGLRLAGIDIVFEGNVPIGSGLSSSAAMEVASLKAFQCASGFEMEGVEAARVCQQAEYEFVGMRCGIMDQMISALGKEGHALFIDCRSIDYQLVPLPHGASIVVADSMVRRGLVDSEYNLRREQCEEGARLLGVKALRDVTPEDFESRKDLLPEEVRKRCEHVVREDQRVLDSITALQSGDLATFGKLMNASHDSLRDLYEVSCKELDLLVEIARGLEGCSGSRLTGAGFGGCTVSLVDTNPDFHDNIEIGTNTATDFASRLAGSYREKTDKEPQVCVCRAMDGASVILAK